MESRGNRHGKPTIMAAALEKALQAGKSVLVADRHGQAVYRRYGHLTSITLVKDNGLNLDKVFY